MHCRLLPLLFLFFCLPHTPLHSEESLRWLETGGGGGYLGTSDRGMSPLRYGGGQFSARLSYITRRPASRTHVRYRHFAGDLASSQQGVMQARVKHYSHEFSIVHQPLIGAWSTPGRRVYAGAGWRNSFFLNTHQLYRNSNPHPVMLSELELNVGLVHQLGIFGKTLFWEKGGSFTPLAYAARNTFSYPLSDAQIRANNQGFYNFLRSGNVYGPGGYRSATLHTGLMRILENGNALRMDYHWGGHSLADVNPVQWARHQLWLSILFNF